MAKGNLLETPVPKIKKPQIGPYTNVKRLIAIGFHHHQPKGRGLTAFSALTAYTTVFASNLRLGDRCPLLSAWKENWIRGP